MKFSVFGDFIYSKLQDTLIAYSSKDFLDAFRKLEEYRKTFFCVGFISYEAHKAFNDSNFCSSFPLLYFGIFAHREKFKPQATQAVFFPHHCSLISEADYLCKVQSLKHEIALGNTYQGNLTTFFKFQSTLESFELFRVLLARQETAYKAFLPTSIGDILSFSPELFFEIKGGEILAKPMKGTIKRGETQKEDEANRLFLSQDIKNRSENVMIVDLLRNDLSKIVQKGTLRVPKLFEIEEYPTLFQMTSSIKGMLKPSLSFLEILEALFPCGSITGAPKKNTLEILETLEEEQRGVYCGAIGVLQKENALFSIPIRTLIKKGKKCFYGVGSGIVWDSDPLEEYDELKTKMRFLTPTLDFSLVETILYTPQSIQQEFLELPSGLAFLSLHLERLKKSAQALGFQFQEGLKEHLLSLAFDEPKIIRILLNKQGRFEIQVLPYEELESKKILLQSKDFRSDLDQFKTTLNQGIAYLREKSLFDVINHQEGVLLEGMRSNIALKLKDGIFTPKDEGHFLRGICREVLLQKGVILERKLFLSDLQKAERIFCMNSVRGMVEVSLF